VDPRFVGNYKRLYLQDGWIDKTFVNYYAGPPDGKHSKMTEQLINSVHRFSSQPIVVVHFGLVTPSHWVPELFDRLVLLHASPLPASAGRSFNFNKLRAMMLVRARIVVELDSDQFVAPGVDAIFARTEDEVTKDYPMPILPAHFLDRTPKDTGPYWDRFCPAGECVWQTLRWGHAHPTWTFWALPFLGRWLRRNLRDEWLPMKKDGKMSALRVVDVPEDEDLLNIATWEEQGTKQWCKFDNVDPSDFDAPLAIAHSDACNSFGCGHVTADPRWHPHGVPKVFYTAHHAVDPKRSAQYLNKIAERYRAALWPPPILFKQRFFKNGQELKSKHPEVNCLI